LHTLPERADRQRADDCAEADPRDREPEQRRAEAECAKRKRRERVEGEDEEDLAIFAERAGEEPIDYEAFLSRLKADGTL